MSDLSLPKVLKAGPGWYRGDFHAHTTYSDGKYMPEALAGMARDRGLDFFAITEHNNIDSFPHFGEDAGVLVIPGLEVTLDVGHWNVFGLTGWRDWMEGICGDRLKVSLPEGRTTTGVMQQIASQGLFNSINHPFLKPWEWQAGATELRPVNFLEIWNDPYWPDNATANPEAVSFWTASLNAGYRITAIGGSDFHFLPGDHKKYPGELIGLPSTYVYAENLSWAEILEGLRQGCAYLSMGPEIIFQAHFNGELYNIGSDLGGQAGEIELAATISGSEDGQSAKIVKNGRCLVEAPIEPGRGEIAFRDQVDPAQPAWYRLEIDDRQGKTIAITNPIFAGPSLEPAKETFQEINRAMV